MILVFSRFTTFHHHNLTHSVIDMSSIEDNIEDSPHPLIVQTLVVTELDSNAPPNGTVPRQDPTWA